MPTDAAIVSAVSSRSAGDRGQPCPLGLGVTAAQSYQVLWFPELVVDDAVQVISMWWVVPNARECAADPSWSIPNAFNEVVRLESPIRVFSRVATNSTALGGISVRLEARMAVLYGSANKDALHFPDPESLTIDRANAGEHLGFGYGVHSWATHALLSAMTKAVAPG